MRKKSCATETPKEVWQKPAKIDDATVEVDLPEELMARYELLEEFRVSEPPPPILPDPFPLSPTMEEGPVVTAEDLGYV
uniref:Uncharacterized protein n=1 Tax=Oryza brachyantha TaxID=4533 RepID=J3LVU0_ORYBR